MCRKWVIPYLYTLRRTTSYAYTLPIPFAYLITYIPILLHALPILIHWLGSRLSAPYLNTLPTRLGNTRQPSPANQNRVLRHTSRHSIRIENGKNPSTSSANQNRVLRYPSRQPIRIEHCVVITSPKSSRLGVKTLLGSRLESARYSLS